MQDNVTASDCHGWLMRIHTWVKEKGGYFEYKLWHFNSSVTQYFFWRMLNIWLLFIIGRWIMVWNKAVFCMEVVIYKLLHIWRHNNHQNPSGTLWEILHTNKHIIQTDHTISIQQSPRTEVASKWASAWSTDTMGEVKFN